MPGMLEGKKILLHICCAPCAVYTIDFLQKEGLKIYGLFYNPNIHGEQEYTKRLKDVQALCDQSKIELVVPKYEVEEYFAPLYEYEKRHYRSIEHMPKLRCAECYRLRLNYAAAYAKQIKADMFSTSLLISPYQQQSLIWQIGVEAGEKFGVPFYFRDLRKGYFKSIHKAKNLGFTVPKYCGCIYSLKEGQEEKKL
jgi:hypothetical protein